MADLLAILKLKKPFKINYKTTMNLRERCKSFEADKFFKYLSKTNETQKISYLQIINEVNSNIKYTYAADARKVARNKKQTEQYVEGFFAEYMPQKLDEVKQIFNGTHPLFINKKGKKQVSFKKAYRGEKSSGVQHVPGTTNLRFYINLYGDLNDYITTAHEISHALSASMQNLSLNNYDPHAKLTEKSYEKDCMCEIESHITEKLFVEYMHNKKIFSDQDVKNYNDDVKEDMYFHSRLLSEELKIISVLPPALTIKSLSGYYENLKKSEDARLMRRFKRMCQGYSNYNCYYVYRYFVAKIVADQWYKEYQSSPPQKQQNMLNTFQNYLEKTDQLNIESACQMLMGKNFETIASNYINDLKQDNKNKKQKTRAIIEQTQQTKEDGQDVFGL